MPEKEWFEEALADYGEILTVKEVAQALRLGENTVLSWLAAGTLQGFKPGRDWRLLKRTLIEDLMAHYGPTRAEGSPATAVEEPPEQE